MVDLLWRWRGKGTENRDFHFVLVLKSQGGGWRICFGFGVEMVMNTVVFIWFLDCLIAIVI